MGQCRKVGRLARAAQFDVNYECGVEKRHAGKYVVIIDGKVVAHGSDPDAVIKDASKKHPNKIPFMYRVPTGESMLL